MTSVNLPDPVPPETRMFQCSAIAGRRSSSGGAFALLASLALHEKGSGDERFLAGLTRIERAAADERNFVRKGVSWALRSIGRRNRALHVAALAAARRLADSAEPAARWVGRDALGDLTRPLVKKQLAAQPRRKRAR